MNKLNRKKIQELIIKKGYKRMIIVNKKVFWEATLVKEALNLIDEKTK